MDRWCWQRGFEHSNSDGCGTNPNITCATNISKEVEKFSSQLETLWDFPGLSVCDDKAWPGRPRGGQLQASQQKRFRAFSGWSCRLGMELRSGPQGARLPKLFCISGPGTSVLNSLCGSLSKIFSSESLPRPSSCRRQGSLEALFHSDSILRTFPDQALLFALPRASGS